MQESKLYSDRLAALEAELLEARAAEQQSRQRHQEHLGQLEPLRNKHRHHKVRGRSRSFVGCFYFASTCCEMMITTAL